ncbi:MAG: hypothetical protein WCT37_04045 [Patescibacteria group bacterium]|jgi:photosystem II stability/assembly factor-like uncharacterized protein
MSKKVLILLSLALSLPLLAGCQISLGGKTAVGNDGGIFKTIDQGGSWQAKNLIPTTSGAPASINAQNIKRIVSDPQDHLAIYLVTATSGLIFTYDGGENWQLPRSLPGEMKSLEDVAVDPKDSCTLYGVALNRIFKSTNCARDWRQVYYGTRASDVSTSVAVDWYTPKIIYVGTAEGNFLKSSDSGLSWTNIKSMGNRIRKIIVDPRDSRMVYVATEGAGIFRTATKGVDWSQLRDPFNPFAGALQYRDLVLDRSVNHGLAWASPFGILKSGDGGETWTAVNLLTKPGSAAIYSVAVDPENSNGLYYATDSTFYKSLDGGQNWITTKLPTTRAGTVLAIDPLNTKVLYLGTTLLQKK